MSLPGNPKHPLGYVVLGFRRPHAQAGAGGSQIVCVPTSAPCVRIDVASRKENV
ncbi:MAG: hypothetical protein WCI11_06740 [Candidatus Methylumidiphilus sp.]